MGEPHAALVHPEIDLLRELYRREMADFVRDAWPIVEPVTRYSHNWHIDAICDHLSAISRGELQRLVVNVPPRFMKSLLVSVLWPAWEWGAFGLPSSRWIFSTYAQRLSTRDSLKCRRVLESPWYRRLFGHLVRLTTDQNEKRQFENDRTGYRIATSVEGGATGEGADRIVVDDPHNVLDTESPAALETTLLWWDEAMSTRLNDQASGSKVIVMQRIKDNDLAGHVLAKGGYQHLMLPMEYERRRATVTFYGPGGEALPHYPDPRREDGELLWPERFPTDVVVELKKDLGTYAAAGQLQQDPAPRAGGMFKAIFWQFYDLPPKLMAKQMDECVASWDCTFKATAGTDYVAGHVWGRKGVEYYLLARDFDRMTFTQTRDKVYQMSAEWRQWLIASLIEDKANGPAVVDSLKTRVQGLLAITPQGGKTARANAIVPTQEAGQIWLPNPNNPGFEWVRDLVTIFSRFPKGETDDDVDAASQAIRWFSTRENEEQPSSAPAVGGQRVM